MCDVPSIAVFCSESIECFPGTASKFFLKLLVTIINIIIIIGGGGGGGGGGGRVVTSDVPVL